MRFLRRDVSRSKKQEKGQIKTWSVSPEGPPKSDFVRIQEAVDAAKPGEIISIAAGTYVENVQINKDIVLRGAGPELTIIQSKEGPVISINGGSVSVSSLKVEGGKGHRYPQLGDGICIEGSAKVVLANIVAESNEVAGFRIRQLAEAELADCVAVHNKSCGIVITRSAFATIKRTQILENEKVGMALQGGMEDVCKKETVISECEISRNKGYGVLVQDNPPVCFQNVRIEENKKHGLLAWNKARFRLLDSIISANGGHGVFFATYAPGDPVEITYPPKVEAIIKGNAITRNEGFGMAVGQESIAPQYPKLATLTPPEKDLPMKMSLILSGRGNNIPGKDSTDGTPLGALNPPYLGGPWPREFVSALVDKAPAKEKYPEITVGMKAEKVLELLGQPTMRMSGEDFLRQLGKVVGSGSAISRMAANQYWLYQLPGVEYEIVMTKGQVSEVNKIEK